MLRILLAVVVLANVLFLAWSQGWLAPLLPPPERGTREAGRLQNQFRPEVVRVLPPAPAASAPGTSNAASAGVTGASASAAESASLPASAPATPSSAPAETAAATPTRASAAPPSAR